MRLPVLLIAASILLQNSAFAADPTMTVTSALAEERTTATVIHGTGVVMPWMEVAVTPGVQGVVVREVLVEVGDKVDAGQVLAHIDARALETAVASAVANEESARAALSKARAALDRGTGLAALKAVSKAEIETLRESLAQAEANVTTAKSSVTDAEDRLREATVIAPVGGQVLSVAIQAGARTAASSMFTIAQDGVYEVSASIPEKRLALVKDGQPADITFLDGSKRTGKVRLVSPAVDAKTHLGTAAVSLDDLAEVRNGMFARVAIKAEPGRSVVVPSGAITYRSNAPTVFKVENNGAVRAVRVSPGSTVEGMTSVSGDVRNGDRIVLDGAGFVEDGDIVAVAEGDQR